MSVHAYDANGNTLSDPSGKQYTWDFENRLTQVVVTGTGITTFKYDPFGRRVQKSGPLGTTNYLYDGPELIAEIDNSGNLLARYTQGPGIDQPFAELRSGTSSYYEQDWIGAVTSLSNSAGALANTYTYDSFGNLTASSGADEITVSAPFRRVDLEALKRPRLGGKEPSDDDYRLRFAHALPADSHGGYRERRVRRAPIGT